jgi:hypothetical protein
MRPMSSVPSSIAWFAAKSNARCNWPRLISKRKTLRLQRKSFEAVIDLVGGLLSAGYPQPWMYQALSLSMEACDYPDSEIKRVLMSNLDFEGDSNRSLEIAKYLARKGMRREALQLLEDVAKVEPHRYDVFALALPLASELDDFDALRWACLGVLRKAWPKEQASLFEQASLKARTAALALKQQGRVLEAQAFEEDIKAALRRDLVVRVNWTGDADLDIRVKEPAGTICSLSNPQTISGGFLVGDTSSSGQQPSLDGYSEYYVCSQGYSGQYDILVRRVWGEVSGGRATVEIVTDYGTPQQEHITKQIDINEKDAVLSVAVKNGHRQEPIAAAHLAAVRDQQLRCQPRGARPDAPSSGDGGFGFDDYLNYRRNLARVGTRSLGISSRWWRGRLSPRDYAIARRCHADGDRCRIGGSTLCADFALAEFNGIGEVFTFNFVTGEEGQGQGGAGGGFGGGGMGGGGFGGGGFGGGGGVF